MDRRALDTPELGIEILSALWRIVGSRRVLEAIRKGRDPRAIANSWREPLLKFGRLREQYLLY